MDRIHHPSAIGTPPTVDVHGTPGYPTEGDPVGGIEATVFTAWTGHSLIEEIRNVIVLAGLTPDKTDLQQLSEAIVALTGSGRLLNVQVFDASGTYTPTPGTNSIIVEAVGGGASGGNGQATGPTQISIGGGGASGSWAAARYTTGFAGATVTIGAGGTSGGAGGTTSFGALLTCPGGAAPTSGTVTSGPGIIGQGSPGAAPSGTGIIYGSRGMPGMNGRILSLSGPVVESGQGGSCPYGGGGINTSGGSGGAGSGYGGGGGGSLVGNNSGLVPGGAGAGGLVIIREFA